jgi:hypothetical protein
MLSCFVFHLPNLLQTQNFAYPTLFSLVLPPAINNDRVLNYHAQEATKKCLMNENEKRLQTFSASLRDMVQKLSHVTWPLERKTSRENGKFEHK